MRAQQWLQSGSGVLQATDLEACDLTAYPDGSNIRDAYQAAIDTDAAVPERWAGTAAKIEVLLPKVWDGTQFVDFTAQTTDCFDISELRQQLITIQVTAPNGKIIEAVEVVKRDLPGSS